MKKLVKYSALLALTFAAVGTLAACSASNSKSESGKSDEKKVTVEVLDTPDQWFGVTYAADRPDVVAKIQSLVDAGEYPSKLF